MRTLAGVLAGALVSGVQMAVSMSNTGGAWDNAKKYVEAGASEHARELGGKGSDCHKAAVISDTVGDPLKDTSGPSLNILIKLMAVESLVSHVLARCTGGCGLSLHLSMSTVAISQAVMGKLGLEVLGVSFEGGKPIDWVGLGGAWLALALQVCVGCNSSGALLRGPRGCV